MRDEQSGEAAFYSRLSRYYDGVFAVSSEEMAFLRTRLAGLSPLLDAGCGTGNRTEHLCSGGVRIVAVDLDQGMIARAREAHSGCPEHPGGPHGSIEYGVMDMMRIDEGFAGQRFAAVLCLGNTLVHLASPEEVTDFCRKAHGLLEPGGLLVMQILNYDRILDKGIRSLPDLESTEARFSRRYEWRDGAMHFMTALHILETGETVSGDAVLYPLRMHELDAALRTAGFAETEYFGGYDGSPQTEESFVTLSISRKG